MIDKTAETEADNGYLLTVDDIEAWEQENGEFPDRAWVLLRTGWQSRAQDETAFLNAGEKGPVTPGPDVEASRWLATERNLSGFGVETVGIDAGAAGGFDPPFPVHNFVLGAGRLGLTQLANLDRLPITGALLVVSPLKLVGGTEARAACSRSCRSTHQGMSARGRTSRRRRVTASKWRCDGLGQPVEHGMEHRDRGIART